MNYVERTKNVRIRHALKGGEVRIANHMVDGYDATNKVVYEYYSCYWHKHSCQKNYDPKEWDRLVQREKILLELDCFQDIVTITSCEWMEMPESKEWYYYPTNAQPITMEDILQDGVNDRLFGFVTVDIHAPEDLIPRSSEFLPIFSKCRNHYC